MLIVSYYVFTLLYGALAIYLLNLNPFTHVLDWLWIGLILMAAFIISFATQILIAQIVGLLRRNKPKDDPFNHRFANALLRLAIHLLRIKVTVSGKENIPSTPFILVGNHQELYDIIILKPIFKHVPLDFIAKEAIKDWPIFGRWIKTLGNVFISKYADRSAARSIVQGIRNYKEGIPMAIFPEGKRSYSNCLIDFKPGAFKLAMKPKADIVIVTQYDVCKVLKSIPWRRYHVKVHVHPVLTYEQYKDLNSHELSDMVKDIIQTQLDEFKKDER